MLKVENPLNASVDTFPADLPIAERFSPKPLDPWIFYDDGTVSVWLPITKWPGWRALIVFARRGHLVEVVDFRMQPMAASGIDESPKGGITRRMLCAVPFGELAADARQTFKALFPDAGETVTMPTGAFFAGKDLAEADLAIDPVTAARTRSGGFPDIHYARAAAAFVRYVEAHHAAPSKMAAIERNLSRSRMRDALREARQRGLLTEGRRGKAEGELTQKAKDLLSQEG